MSVRQMDSSIDKHFEAGKPSLNCLKLILFNLLSSIQFCINGAHYEQKTIQTHIKNDYLSIISTFITPILPLLDKMIEGKGD